MPQEFRAIVSDTKDTSKHVEETWEDGMKRTAVARSADIILKSFTSCPWPPEQLIGKKVRVIVED